MIVAASPSSAGIRALDRTGLGVVAILCVSLAGALAAAESDEGDEGKDSPLPDDVVRLKEGYTEALEKVAAPIRRLQDSYVAKLQELKARMQAAGQLEATLAVREEIERVAEDGAPPGRGSELDGLADLQRIYHEFAANRAFGVNRRRAGIEKTYIESLGDLIAKYTQQGELSTALRLKEMRDAAEKRHARWRRLAASYSDDYDPFDHLDWERLGEIIEAGHLTPTERVGGARERKETTRDLPEEPSLLVGFDLHMAPFRRSDDTVRKIVPLWRSKRREVTEGIPRAVAEGRRRRRVLAKDGYVVSGITTHSGAGVRKIRFTFSRLDGMKLDESDSYETDFYGEWEGGRVASLSTDGKLPVGLDGWVGGGTSEFWLLLADPP